MERDRRRGVIGGSILIAVGFALLAMQYAEDFAGAFVLSGLGAAFLAMHLVYRSYGLLVPGGVLLGLGVGLIAQESGAVRGDTVVLGLGLGFLLIYVVDRLITRRGPVSGSWWPLIPGGIITAVGIGSMFPDLSEKVVRFGWAAAIIVLGLVLVFRGLRRGPT